MSERNVRLYIEDIIESGEAILDYIKSLDFKHFSKDRKTIMAVIKEFEIIGEAVSKLPPDIKNKYKEVPWRDIKGFRNILVHAYFGVDKEFIWNIINTDLKNLLKITKKIKSDLKRDNP